MDFNAHDHIWRVIPHAMGLRHLYDVSKATRDAAISKGMAEEEAPKLADVPVFHLRGVTAADVDRANFEFRNFSADHNADENNDFSRKQQQDIERAKFVKVENLTVNGETVTTYDDFVAKAPADLVTWFRQVIYSYQALSEAERKN